MTNQVSFHISLIFLILSRQFSNGFQHFPNFTQTDRHGSLFAATSKLIDEFNQFTSDNLVIAIEATSKKSANIQKDILTKVLLKSGSVRPYSVHNSENLKETSNRIYNLFLVDSYESFLKIYGKQKRELEAPLGFYVVVVSVPLHDPLRTLTDIFKQFWKLFVLNVVVLTPSIDYDLIEIYTYFPFTRTHCREVVPVLHDEFRDGQFERKVPFFPLKLTDFHGCPLNVTVFQFMPFVNLTYSEDGTMNAEGIDARLLRILANILNFTPSLQIPIEDPPRGVVYENGTVTGAMRMVKEGESDFTICGYGYTYLRATYLSASVPYLDNYMMFAAPVPALYSSLEQLLFPFEFSVWAMIAVTFICGFVVTTFLKFLGNDYIEFLAGPKNLSSTFHMVNTSFGGSLTKIPRRNFARTMLILWILLTTILRNSYQGTLFKYLQSKRPTVLKESVKELVAMGYKVYIQNHWPSVVDLLNLTEGQYAMMETDRSKYYEYLHKPGFRGIIVNTNTDLMYFNTLNRRRPTIKPLADKLFYFPCSIFFKKNSYLVRPFDRSLLRFFSSGLIQLWSSEILNRPYREHKTESPEAKSITIENLSGSFQIFSVLMFVALLVFILECLAKVSSRIQWFVDFYTF